MVKNKTVLCALLAFCLFALTAAGAPADAAGFSIAASAETAAEGGSITFSIFIDFSGEVEGGAIALDVPEGIFTEAAEIELDLAEPAVFDAQTPVAQFELTLEGSVLEQTETEKEITVSVSQQSYIVSGGVSHYAPEGANMTFTVVAEIIGGEVQLYSGIQGVDGIEATLSAEGAAPIAAQLELSGKKLLYSVRKSLLDQSAQYTITISGAGFVSTEAAFGMGENAVLKGFYPGDLNGDGAVDVYDFNLLCAYIHYGQTEAAADLNRDGSVSADDIKGFKDGYSAKIAEGGAEGDAND